MSRLVGLELRPKMPGRVAIRHLAVFAGSAIAELSQWNALVVATATLRSLFPLPVLMLLMRAVAAAMCCFSHVQTDTPLLTAAHD